MTKLEAMQQKYNKATALAAEEREKIAKMENDLEDLKQKEAAAATAGDFATYKAVKDKRSDLEEQLFVHKASNPIVTLIKRADVLAAWDESAAAYKKAITPLEKELEEAIKTLLIIYRKMVTAQVKMLQDRDECAKMLGLDPMGQNNDGRSDFEFYADKYANDLPIDFLKMKTAAHFMYSGGLYKTQHLLTAFLEAAGKLSNDDVAFDTLIFKNHRLF